MPNRMLRDWTGSDKINGLSVQAERFFTRLIMKVDDYGCFHADHRLLKANLFPLLLDSIREADMLRWAAECQKAELIVLYESDGKKYLQIIDFRQRLDKARNKFPLPSSGKSLSTVTEFPAEVEVEVEVEASNTRPDLSNSNLFRKPKIPTLDQVKEKFLQNGGTLDMAAKFFESNEATGWFLRGSPITNFANLVGGYVSNWKRNDNSKDGSVAPMTSAPLKKLGS